MVEQLIEDHRAGGSSPSLSTKQLKSIYNKEHYKNNKNIYLEKAKRLNRKYKERNRYFINRVKQIYGCSNCKYKRCLSALEFHHLKDKDFNISILVATGRKLETLKEELRKCVLLCSNCHREVHEGLIKIKAELV